MALLRRDAPMFFGWAEIYHWEDGNAHPNDWYELSRAIHGSVSSETCGRVVSVSVNEVCFRVLAWNFAGSISLGVTTSLAWVATASLDDLPDLEVFHRLKSRLVSWLESNPDLCSSARSQASLIDLKNLAPVATNPENLAGAGQVAAVAQNDHPPAFREDAVDDTNKQMPGHASGGDISRSTVLLSVSILILAAFNAYSLYILHTKLLNAAPTITGVPPLAMDPAAVSSELRDLAKRLNNLGESSVEIDATKIADRLVAAAVPPLTGSKGSSSTREVANKLVAEIARELAASSAREATAAMRLSLAQEQAKDVQRSLEQLASRIDERARR